MSLKALNQFLTNDLKSYWPYLWNADEAMIRSLQDLVLFIAFKVELTLDVNIVWFGCQKAVCVIKQHENAWLGCLLPKLLIHLAKTET